MPTRERRAAKEISEATGLNVRPEDVREAVEVARNQPKRSQSEMTTKLLRSVPARLKGKIARAADQRGVSVNGLIVETLAAHYGIEYVASTTGRGGGRERTSYPNIVLTMPEELRDRIEADAATSGETDTNTMKAILSEAFGEPFVRTGRWAATA